MWDPSVIAVKQKALIAQIYSKSFVYLISIYSVSFCNEDYQYKVLILVSIWNLILMHKE